MMTQSGQIVALRGNRVGPALPWRRPVVRCVCRLAAFVLGIVVAAHCEAQPPELRPEPGWMGELLHAEEPFFQGRGFRSTLKIKLPGTATWRGDVRFRLQDGANVTLGEVTWPDQALTGPEVELRVVLPPQAIGDIREELGLRCELVTSTRTILIGWHPLRVPVEDAESLALGHCLNSDSPRVLKSGVSVHDLLRLETLLFGHLRSDDWPEAADRIRTTPSTFSPREMPVDPIGFGGIDGLVISGDTFGLLRGPQLDALNDWVRAGGRVAIHADGPLGAAQRAWLERATRGAAQPIEFEPDGVHTLDAGLAGGAPWVFARHGNGRVLVVLISDEMLPDVDRVEWRNAGFDFWDVNRSTAASLMAPVKPGNPSIGYSTVNGRGDLYDAFNAQFRPMVGQRLLPRTLRTIPMGIVLSIFGGMLVAIGPLDYFVLGWLKRRRWTWITFPCIVLSSTALLVFLANVYLGGEHQRRSIILTDYEDAGQPVCEHRLELVLPSVSGPVMIRDESGLVVTRIGPSATAFTDLPCRPSGVAQDYRNVPQTLEGRGLSARGRYPFQTSFHASMRQWSPELFRTLRFVRERREGDDAGAAKLGYETSPHADRRSESLPLDDFLDRTLALNAPTLKCAFRLDAVRARFGPEAIVVQSQGDELRTYDLQGVEQGQLVSEQLFHESYSPVRRTGSVEEWRYPTSAPTARLLPEFLKRRGVTLLQRLINSDPPQGGRIFNDIAVRPEPESGDMAAMIVVPAGDDFHVHRWRAIAGARGKRSR